MIIFISISYRMDRCIYMNEIRHYGVKGMKWGVRRNLISNARESHALRKSTTERRKEIQRRGTIKEPALKGYSKRQLKDLSYMRQRDPKGRNDKEYKNRRAVASEFYKEFDKLGKAAFEKSKGMNHPAAWDDIADVFGRGANSKLYYSYMDKYVKATVDDLNQSKRFGKNKNRNAVEKAVKNIYEKELLDNDKRRLSNDTIDYMSNNNGDFKKAVELLYNNTYPYAEYLKDTGQTENMREVLNKWF